MGVWIELEEGEPITDSLRRFRKLIQAEGAYPLHHCKWHKPRRDFYLKPSILNRRRRWIIRARKKGPGPFIPDPDYEWADDIETRPRRAWGPTGRRVVT
jgi:ribosomal protein S21